MNYYQRPALITGDTISANSLDNEVACRNLINVINIIKPNAVIFISKKSYNKFNEDIKMIESNIDDNKLIILGISQPGTKYWNRDKGILYNHFLEWLQ